MREIFRGWRRKAGCVTLMLALAVLLLWVRSHVFLDFYSFSVAHHDQKFRRSEFGSFHGNLCWRSRDEYSPMPPNWLKLRASNLSAKGYLDLEPQVVAASQIRQWTIPHLWIVMLLNLLSAYLFLWKPRKLSSAAPTFDASQTARELISHQLP